MSTYGFESIWWTSTFPNYLITHVAACYECDLACGCTFLNHTCGWYFGGRGVHNNNNNNRIQRRYSRFFTISSQRRELSPTRTLKWPGRNRVQITCSTWSAYPVQVSYVTCHLVRRDSSAIKFDRVEIAFIWALFFWLNHCTNEGGEETGEPGENPWRRA